LDGKEKWDGNKKPNNRCERRSKQLYVREHVTVINSMNDESSKKNLHGRYPEIRKYFNSGGKYSKTMTFSEAVANSVSEDFVEKISSMLLGEICNIVSDIGWSEDEINLVMNDPVFMNDVAKTFFKRTMFN